jgi:hypothetical protein
MTVSDITSNVRRLIDDNLVTVEDVFTYGSSTSFTPTESNVSSIVDVLVNDVSSGVTHSYNSTTGKVTVTSSLTAGDTVEIQYTCYKNYSDAEIKNYIRNALIHLTINQYYTFEYDSTGDEIYPTPSTKEGNLIALITSILINPDNRTIRLPDITISVPNDDPTDIKISKAIAKFKHDTHGIFNLI